MFALCIFYWLWYFTSSESDTKSLENSTTENVVSVKKNISATSSDADIQIHNANPSFVKLPYGATDIFVTGIQEVKRPDRTHREFIFEFITEKYGTFSIDSYELASMGFSIQYFSPCNVLIKNSAIAYRALCSPNPYEQPNQENDDLESTSLFSSL